MEPAKRQRAENWPTEDKQLLIDLVHERRERIENKSQDTDANVQKNEAWIDLMHSFNSKCVGQIRDVMQLKTQHRQIKMAEMKSEFPEEDLPPMEDYSQETDDCIIDNSWPSQIFVSTPKKMNKSNKIHHKRIIQQKKKRKRCANWEREEKRILRDTIEEHMAIVESKACDTNTNKQKQYAWRQIFHKFNSLNSKKRSIEEIKQQWRALKKGIHQSQSAEEEGKTDNHSPSQERDVKHVIVQEYQDQDDNSNDSSSSNSLSASVTAEPINFAQNIAEVEMKCRKELHTVQMKNERLKTANIELEKILLRKKIEYYSQKINSNS